LVYKCFNEYEFSCYNYDVEFDVLRCFLETDCDYNEEDNYTEDLNDRIKKIIEVEKNYGE
jgi:hypothetical protein